MNQLLYDNFKIIKGSEAISIAKTELLNYYQKPDINVLFGNSNTQTNGEYQIFNILKNHISTIFDVGSRDESIFLEFKETVHYFEPVPKFLNSLMKQPNKNIESYFNNFGLSNIDADIPYYSKYEAFTDRVFTTFNENSTSEYLQVKTAHKYILDNNINSIDFLKIDTEGYEFNVLKGFQESLAKVSIIQIEYGTTWADNNISMISVIEYLKTFGFNKFYYLGQHILVELVNFNDHFTFCNIICLKDTLISLGDTLKKPLEYSSKHFDTYKNIISSISGDIAIVDSLSNDVLSDTFNDIDLFKNCNKTFDVIISLYTFGSIETSPLTPNGDLETLDLFKSKLNTNGYCLIGLKEPFVLNNHYAYHNIRLKIFCRGFKLDKIFEISSLRDIVSLKILKLIKTN